MFMLNNKLTIVFTISHKEFAKNRNPILNPQTKTGAVTDFSAFRAHRNELGMTTLTQNS